MSLDVYLTLDGDAVGGGDKIFIREKGSTQEISREEWDRRFPGREPVVVTQEPSHEVFSWNITHNLGKMADAAGIYEALWRPDEHGIETAEQLIEPLQAGLAKLETEPARFQKLNPPNGWGDYGGLVAFVRAYLAACFKYPKAKVSVSR